MASNHGVAGSNLKKVWYFMLGILLPRNLTPTRIIVNLLLDLNVPTNRIDRYRGFIFFTYEEAYHTSGFLGRSTYPSTYESNIVNKDFDNSAVHARPKKKENSRLSICSVRRKCNAL